MFNQLSDKVLGSVKKLRGLNKISDANIEEAIKEIRVSLLDADVNFKVVKSFIDRVKVKAIGTEVLASVNPGQMFVKIVHDELVATLGGSAQELALASRPSVIMMVGLQGAGKTTSSAKLALHLRQKMGKKVGLVPADVYRPARALPGRKPDHAGLLIPVSGAGAGLGCVYRASGARRSGKPQAAKA